MTKTKTTGFCIALASLLSLGGCASNGDPRDPLEPMNRALHSFNETVDKAALKPLATGYQTITPKPARIGVSNFFSNLDDVTVLANDLLQFKVEQGSSDLLRLAINSTFGLLGVLDVATPMGLKKHNEDFGQTMGKWGLGSGPYLVLPFFGPSSFRDAAGRVVDSAYTDLVYDIEDAAARYGTVAFRVISRRADLLEAKEAIAEAALDTYELNRDFFLERRKVQINDGPLPLEE